MNRILIIAFFRRWKIDKDELRTLYVNSVQDKAEAL